MTAEEFYLKEAIFKIPKNRTISKFSYDELIIFAEAYAEHELNKLKEDLKNNSDWEKLKQERNKYKALAKLYKLQDQEIFKAEQEIKELRELLVKVDRFAEVLTIREAEIFGGIIQEQALNKEK